MGGDAAADAHMSDMASFAEPNALPGIFDH
jgi:hypothetical protein